MLERSLNEIRKLLRTRAITVEALAEEAIANRDEDLLAYRAVDDDRLRKTARAADAALKLGRDFGPLHGIPISVKDLYGVPGFDTCAGTPTPLPDRFDLPGPVVRACLDAFALIVGKTHTVEFAFSGIGMNKHWGTPKNPWDAERHRIPGGSSAGAGVSLAEGSALVALGTDTAGSVRVPASMTGNVGMKTTKGRWSTEGIVPLSTSLDTPGILTRTVEDAIVAFETIDGATVPDTPDLSSLRFGVPGAPFFDECDPGIAEAVESAAGALAACGARVTPVDVPEGEAARQLFRAGGVAAQELYAFLKTELEDRIEHLDPVVRDRVVGVAEEPAYQYVARLEEIRRLSDAGDARIAPFDAWLTPTCAGTPPEVASITDIEAYRRANMLALRNTSIVNCLGQCAVTIPIALDPEGMPIGLHLIGRRGEDHRLLAVARSVERALGTTEVRIGRPPRRSADTKNG
ncbi:MAG: amidase [Deltaproteobacteria bacterium]